ncbi:MAG: hypothetical protein IJU43_09565 [Lachnospiraceae bacterium]|nr:hypothetical protein [Lachnospiraceae bacterium]
MDKNYDKLQLADSWLASIKHYTGRTLFQPSKWADESKQLVIDMRESKKKLQKIGDNIEILSDILDMVQAVDTARQVARRKELQKSAPVMSQPQHQQHQEQDQPGKPKKGGDAR